MIDDDLINKFDSIEDLPISEEMLGAYLEGNLDDAESIFVNNAINSFSDVSEIVLEIPVIENLAMLEILDYDFSAEIFSIMSDVELPNISDNILNNTSICLQEEISLMDSHIADSTLDEVQNSEPTDSDISIRDSEFYISQDDSFYKCSNSLESNNNSDSFNDEDMFNSNFDI